MAGLASVPTSGSMAQKKKDEDLFVHHVYFWLKDGNSAQDKSKLLEGLNSLKKVETIKMIHIGKPAATNRDVIDTSYHYSLLLVFNNLADQEIYQKHPVHLDFVKNYSHLWSKVIVYDSINA